MSIKNYEGKKFLADEAILVDDALTEEAALQITINQKPFSLTMRTPGSDDALIRGLLFSEDIYRGMQPISIRYRQKNKVIRVADVQLDRNQIGPGFNNNRTLLSVSSCGICGKQKLDDVSTYKACLNSNVQLEVNKLYTMFSAMQQMQQDFKHSGGSHAAAAFDNSGQLLSIKEDIGRHNAVDKVIGDLLNNKKLEEAICMVVSGRISYEIVAKTYSVAIPILAAVSAPSSLAVEYAKQFGLSLMGFSRGSKTTCYANDWRLKL
jgi:FdhD protein